MTLSVTASTFCLEAVPSLNLGLWLVQELEKFKFVLDYKIKELKKQIEPKEEQIADMKDQVKVWGHVLLCCAVLIYLIRSTARVLCAELRCRDCAEDIDRVVWPPLVAQLAYTA